MPSSSWAKGAQMNRAGTTDAVLDAVEAIRLRPLSESDDRQVRRCLLDYAGCAIGGSAELQKIAPALGIMGDGGARVIGTDLTSSAVGAAFANGFCSHVLELDDGHRRAMQHLGAPVFSVLFALADESTEWDSFAKAVVCGYEVAIALGEALQPRHKLDGFHATGTCGAIGAAVAACVLKGRNRAQIKRTIAAAATSAAGLLEVIGEGSALKPYNVAHACAAAIIAAGMAESACDGPNDVLGGKRGFLANFHGDASKLEFGHEPRIHQIYTKPYSACRHCHSPIECAERIVAAHPAIKPGDVESVLVETYDLAVFGHDQTSVANASEAKMSTPFGIASVVCGKGAYMDAYAERGIHDPVVASVMEKVSVKPDADLTAASPDKRGARVTVRLCSGESFTELVEYPKGEPENAMSDGDLGRKARGLILTAGFGRDEAKRIEAAAWETRSVTEFVAMCCKEQI